MAASKDCPVWKKEKHIQKVKTENHLGYPEARRLVEGATPSPGAKTYAAAPRVSTRTVDCQTDITWLSRPQAGAAAVGSQSKPKKKPQTDRLPKGSSDPIAQANRFLLLPDDPGEVEMAEAAPRGNQSLSPKKKLRGPSPVVAEGRATSRVHPM